MPTEDTLPGAVENALERLNVLVRKFEEHPDEAIRDDVTELLRCVDVIHRAGLSRAYEVSRAYGMEDAMGRSPEVQLLFDLYEVDDNSAKGRAEAVLELVRVEMEGGGVHAEMLEAAGGCIKLRVSGGSGCAAGALQPYLESLFSENLSEFRSLEIVRPPKPAANFVPLSSVKPIRRSNLTWHPVLDVASLKNGEIRAVEIESKHILLTCGDKGVFAFRNACPGSALPLDRATVEDGVLICPWHGCRFDICGGRRLDKSGTGLGLVPSDVAEGMIRIGLPEKAGA
ncbi:MAG: Rieske (2Fe-2S) protein [Armatimonadetes bacterium]|nr:Rieske (2Fe-2S) protein [Armatimonadota bacterium]